MNRNDKLDRAWHRLAQQAGQVPEPSREAPPGFATRVLAHWREARGESTLAMLEWLTLRGLAVALFILLGCAALGYDTLLGVFSGETGLAGGWFDSLLTL